MALKIAKREIDKPIKKPKTGIKKSSFYTKEHQLDHEDIREIKAYSAILKKKKQIKETKMEFRFETTIDGLKSEVVFTKLDGAMGCRIWQRESLFTSGATLEKENDTEGRMRQRALTLALGGFPKEMKKNIREDYRVAKQRVKSE